MKLVLIYDPQNQCKAVIKGIFDFTLDYTGGSLEEMVIIGDNLHTDVLGAYNAGWKSVWYNPLKESISHSQLQVFDLIELPRLFM